MPEKAFFCKSINITINVKPICADFFMKISLIAFVLFIALSSHAQGYKHFTIEQGLPSNRTYKIIQDYDGYIWIATDKGLAKFDGSYFKNFTTADGLPSNDIWEIILTKDNKLWFFTRSNRLGYIQNDSIYNFYAEDKNFLYPTTINTDLQKIVFRSYNNNYKLANGQWHAIRSIPRQKNKVPLKLIHDSIHYMQSNAKGKKTEIALYNRHNQIIKKYIIPKRDLYINGQINDSLLVVRLNQGFTFINLKNLTKHNLIKEKLLKPNVFTRLMATEQSVQISSENFWAELDKHYKLKNIHLFPQNFLLSTLYKDKQGNFWGTTYAKGIYFFPKNSLSSHAYLTNQPVQFIKKMQGKLFAGVLNKGIFKYNPEKNKFELFYKLNDYIFDFLYLDDQNFGILANTSTLIKKKGKTGIYYRIGKGVLPIGHKFAVRERNAISIFDDKFKLVKTYPLEGANCFTDFKGKIIAGTPVGIFEMAHHKFNQINPPDKESFPVLSLKKFKEHLIIGTDGLGAYLWDGNGNFKLIPETKNLIINHIQTNGNEVWLASQKGVLNFDYHNGQLIYKKTLRKTDGLVSDHVNHLAILGNKLFSSNFSGIVSVDKNQITDLPIQKIYFKAIKYNNKKLDSTNNHVLYTKNNNISFDFGLIDYYGQEHNRYFYQLLPLQNQWQAIHAKNVNFNSLGPGRYTFKIKVINSYGQVQTASFTFEILPLWWQKDWAKFLMIFIFLTFIFSIGYWTRRKELNKQREKLVAQKQMAEFELHALRSQMNPHFVFNSLNAIQYYINDENYDKSETYLVKFSRLIRMIFEFSRKKAIRLDQEIDLLKSYLNLEKMRFGDNFTYCVKIDPRLKVNQVEIPTLLLQPIVENAVNHGIFHKKGKGTICLDFKYIDPKTFEVTIQDDGVGLEKSKEINRTSLKKHQSRSTQILKERIKLLNLSEKWYIVYTITDTTNDPSTPYNTIVKLKITKL